MMGNIATLVRWEWFKLRRRWMPWILLAILLVFSQLGVWGSFFSYNALEASGGMVALSAPANGMERRPGQLQMVSCNDLRANASTVVPLDTAPEVIDGLLAQCQKQAEQQQRNLQDQYDTFTLPGSLPTAFGIAQTIGLILLAILTASAIGSDYGLGTLRLIMVRGTGRWPYLASKYFMLILVAAGALLIVAIVSTVSSVIATGLVAAPPGGAMAGSSWMDVAIALGKTWGSLIPYVALTGLVTVLTRSSAVAMAIGLGYSFAEPILVSLLSRLFDWFGTVADYLLIRNISALAGGGLSFGQGREDGPGILHSVLVLTAYTLVLCAMAVWLFQRRDVTGANGG